MQPFNNSPLNILLIDDDEDECSLLSKELDKINVRYHLTWVNNALSIIKTLEKESPIDLILLDINMPGKNGKRCLKEIKANEDFRHIPVIIYSVSMREKDIEETYHYGAHYYLVKPYYEVNFIESLRKVFNIDWKLPQPMPLEKDFVINLAFA